MYDAKEKMILASRPCCPIHPDRRCFGGIGASCGWWMDTSHVCAVLEIAKNSANRPLSWAPVRNRDNTRGA